MALKSLIEKYALQNAVKFDGKANPGAVIGKVLSEDEDAKKDMKALSQEVAAVIKTISKLSVAEQEAQLKEIAPELLEKKEQEKKEGLPPLKDAEKGKVVMRFAPSPSGPLHLGHAYALSLNSEYCRMYNGKLILRIDDTNPENIYGPAYSMIPEDAKWVTHDNIAEVVIQSERLGYYYDYAEQLIQQGNAYVCTCDPDYFRELITKKEPCPCRELPKEEQHRRYAKMFGEFKSGEAVMRLKTDIQHKNPAMRDFPLMRINDHKHPLEGNAFKAWPEHESLKGTDLRVWPLMNFAVFVDDVEMGITHVIRAKDHIDNEKRQAWLYTYFNKQPPVSLFVGRINFTDMKISSTETKILIEEGKYEDWSDIRLPFLVALKRRGYQPDAFISYALDVGISQNDKKVSKEEFFKSLNHFNKKVLESKANRYFFIGNPKEITVVGAPKQDVQLNLHPDDPERGKRSFHTTERFFISQEDFDAIQEGELVRLMDCLNMIKKGDTFHFDSVEYSIFKEKGNKIIHWLPVNGGLIATVLLQADNTVLSGLGESGIGELAEGSNVQLERVGFCRLDKKEEEKIVFWFGHR